MKLVASSGPAAGLELEISSRVVIGREEGCDLTLEDEKVSRRHCALTPNADGTVTLEDLGSSNGTFVNGARISAPVVLRGDEEVRVGSTVLRAEGERATRATVVGAPATVVASSPSPPAGPPPAEGASPWWRSRWALIGAVATLVVGGTVGGVLAATGGGDEVAVGTTEEAPPEAATVTVTQPAETELPETEAPPETGSDGETVVDDAGLTPDQQQLLGYVPAQLQSSCQANTDIAAELLREGHLAGLYCPTADGIALYYNLYESKESMDAAYLGYAVGETPTDQGDCSVAFPGEGTYSIGSVPGGRLTCFEAADPVRPAIWWTTDGINVLAFAGWPGRTDRELYDWWATEPGPIP